jgi:hypothetical protein
MPIYSDHWLYPYMDDRDGDGMVGEWKWIRIIYQLLLIQDNSNNWYIVNKN